MPVGRRKPEAAEVTVGDAVQPVDAVGVGRVLDEAVVAELRRQHVAAHDALGVLEVLRKPAPAQDQRGLDDVAGVVDLPPVRNRVVPAGLDHPADLVADLPQAVVVERPDPRQQPRVVEQVGELRQRGHHAGGRMGMRAEPLAVVGARLQEELAGGLVGERHRQFQRRPGAGRPVILHQRADRAGDAGDEGVFADRQPAAALQAVEVPARVGTEQLEQLADAALGELAGAAGAAVLH